MEIRLGIIRQDEKETSIDLADEITETQYDELLNAIREVQTLENNKRLFEIVSLNKRDFVDIVNKNINEMISRSPSLVGGRKLHYEYHLNFNRLFLNYLSSIKTFIDHNDKSIKNKFGKSSVEAKEFTRMNSAYFDNFFCYRFFLKLRDYGLHCGMPLGSFELSTHHKADGTITALAKIEFDPRKLLNEFSEWGKIVTKDLENMTSAFPLSPLLEDTSKLLFEFWKSVDKLYDDRICKAVLSIKKLAGHLREEGGDIYVFTNLQESEEGKLEKMDSQIIPFDIIEELDLK